MDLDKLFKKVEKLIDEALDSPRPSTYSSKTTWSAATAGATPPAEPKRVQFIRSELEFVFDKALDGADPATYRYLVTLRDKYLGKR